MRTPDNRGRSLSVFAPPAAHEHLAQQWGFQLDSRLARQADFGDEASQVRRRMTAAVTQLQTDLSADMRRRGFPETVTGRRNFINQILDENSAYRGGGMGYADARTARAVTSRRLNSILEARTASDRSRLARTAYDETLDFYDNFFTTASQNLQVRLTQSGNVSSHRNTPFADANIGLHRLHAGQRRGLYQRHAGAMRGRHIATDSPAANFLSRHYFQTEVHPNVNYFTSLTPERAQRIVNGIQGAPNNPTPDQAFLWLERNRYPVRRQGTRGRSDAAPRGRGKPCGASHISASYNCGKGGTAGSNSPATTALANKHDKAYKARQIGSIVARVGAVGGGLALVGLSGKKFANAETAAQLVGARDTAIAGVAITAIGVGSLLREKKVTKSSEELAESYEPIKALPGSDAATLTKLQNFIREADIDAQRVPALNVLMGIGGYFTYDKPDRIHVTAAGSTTPEAARDKDPAVAYANGMEKYMKYRATVSESKIKGTHSANTSDMKTLMRNFSASHWVGNSDGKMNYLNAHEIAHAVHYRGDFASPKAVYVNGKRFEGAELEAHLMRSSSYYGQSDLRKTAKGETSNYYEQGNRLETYAENFALYVGNAGAMKKYHPVAYEWTRQTTEYALARPAKKEARPISDIIRELNKGSYRFDPVVLRGDASDSTAIGTLLDHMRDAAVAGNINAALEIFKKAQSLPLEYRFMFGSYLETAYLYSHIESDTQQA